MWFKDDVRNILAGIELSSAQLAAFCPDYDTEAYRAGFRAALLAVAASFGLLTDWPDNDMSGLITHEKAITVAMKHRRRD